MIELVVSMALVLILSAIALPSLTRSYRVYQLNGSARQLAGILKLTRFEAIRKNKPVNCQILQTGPNWTIWADSDGDGVPDPTETQLLITGNPTLVPVGAVPDPKPIATAVGVGVGGLVTPNPAITFDARGAVFAGGPQPPVYVLYLGVPNSPDFGYRAVVLLPSGITQVWTAPAQGPWRRVS